MQLSTLTIERSTAQAAARRELRVIKRARDGADLSLALADYGIWLQRLLGCDEASIHQYIAWRLQALQRFGRMSEQAQVRDAEECVLFIIRRGAKE